MGLALKNATDAFLLAGPRGGNDLGHLNVTRQGRLQWPFCVTLSAKAPVPSAPPRLNEIHEIRPRFHAVRHDVSARILAAFRFCLSLFVLVRHSVPQLACRSHLNELACKSYHNQK